MVFAAFPIATAATDLTGTSSGATSLQANEYTLMDSAHSSNKYEIPPTLVAFVRSPVKLLLSEKLFFFCLASELQRGTSIEVDNPECTQSRTMAQWLALNANEI